MIIIFKDKETGQLVRASGPTADRLEAFLSNSWVESFRLRGVDVSEFVGDLEFFESVAAYRRGDFKNKSLTVDEYVKGKRR